MSPGSASDQGGSAVARRRLGGRLRALRDERDLTRAEAAEAICGSSSKISRLELGRLSFKRSDVLTLLDLYGVDSPTEREDLLALVPVANSRPGWRHHFSDVVPDWFQPYLDLESAAAQIRTYEGLVVPGLLQAADYAEAVMSAGQPYLNGPELQRRVAFRLQRQQAVSDGGTRLWAMIDEAALRREVGGPAVMRAQLAHLLELHEHPMITIQVLPFGMGGHVVDTAGFTLLRLAELDDDLPDMVYLEHLTGAAILDKPRDVTPYNELFMRMVLVGQPPQLSAETIAKILASS